MNDNTTENWPATKGRATNGSTDPVDPPESKTEKTKPSKVFVVFEVAALLIAVLASVAAYLYKANDKPQSSFDMSLANTNSNVGMYEQSISPTGSVKFAKPNDDLAAFQQQLSALKASKTKLSDPLITQYANVSGNEVGEYIVPKESRWKFQFDENLTLGAYAQQLDGLKIELGILDGSGNMTYVTDLSKPKPKSRKASARSERRIYFTWQRGDLIDADATLIKGAKIEQEGRVVFHFLSPTIEKELDNLEAKARATKPLSSILETRFSIKLGRSGYEFFVSSFKERE